MNRLTTRYRAAAAAVVVAAVAAIVGLAPHLGFTSTTTPLWSDRTVAVSPSPTGPAPNWVDLAKTLKPAVVNISTKRVDQQTPMQSPFGDNEQLREFFKRFGVPPESQPRAVRSLGSGFIVNPDGYIVTNNHVVDGATEIRVKMDDGRELSGKVVGRDPKTDLALLKVEASGLPVIPFGDSAQLRVGEPVMAIGNPFGLEQTVTTGIVSATGRVIGQGPYDDFIQTDASINPGNSGGPLINSRGQVVGINNAIFSQSGGSVGIGFAIPINQVKPVVTQLASTGKVTRGWLGVSIQSLTPELAKGFQMSENAGALVASVQTDSPAARAGLKAGDVVTQFDGQKIAHPGDLSRLVANTPVGRKVALNVIRDGKPITLDVTVAQMEEPGQQVASASGDESKGALGLSVEPLTPDRARDMKLADAHGVLVRGVRDGSPAETAGIRPGDVITEVDHQKVPDVAQLKRVLDKHPKGAPIVVMIQRDGASLYVALTA
jgi:serine protease Do